MNNRTMPNTQGGFTLVELVAGMVIMVAVAAYAVPRMLGPSDFAAKVTADRVLAALHYTQALAQRQGVAASAVVALPPGNAFTSGVSVYQAGVPVSFTIQNYDGSTDSRGIYNARLPPEAIVSAIEVVYGADGIPTSGVKTYGVNHGSSDKFRIKVEPTGFAHFE